MSRVLAKRGLILHPDCTQLPFSVACKLSNIGINALKFEFVLAGDIFSVKFPEVGLPERSDGLWQTTCFEAFWLNGNGCSYVELNFSPSRKWASYRFDSYRDGMAPALDMPAPDIFVEGDGTNRFALIAIQEVDRTLLDRELHLGLSCVVENADGAKSYWALRHPPGKPDFHHRDCFALKLAPPE